MNEIAAKLKNLFEELEGTLFIANMRVIAGFELFLDAIENNELVERLIDALEESPSSQQLIKSRILILLNKNDEPDYLHPFDPTIAAYLFALNTTNQDQAREVSSAVHDTPQLWWSRKLAEKILESATDKSRKSVSGKFVIAMVKRVYEYSDPLDIRPRCNVISDRRMVWSMVLESHPKVSQSVHHKEVNISAYQSHTNRERVLV